MKNWLTRFLTGRNGPDELARLCSWSGCIALLISIFVGGIAKAILCAVALVFLVASYWRLLSKNVYKRRAENDRYVQWRYARLQKLQQFKQRMKQRRDYHFYRCAQCGTIVRIPKGHGKVQITCPKCGYHFIRRS